MNVRNGLVALAGIAVLLCCSRPLAGEDIKRSEVYQRICTELDAVRAIDTHDHCEILRENALKLFPTLHRQLWRK